MTRKNVNVLLNVQHVPEESKFYLVEVDADEFLVLKQAHSHFVGSVNTSGANEKAVMSVLAACAKPKTKEHYENVLNKWDKKDWHVKELNMAKPAHIEKAEALFITGIYM